jgi:hypothetical protein
MDAAGVLMFSFLLNCPLIPGLAASTELKQWCDLMASFGLVIWYALWWWHVSFGVETLLQINQASSVYRLACC